MEPPPAQHSGPDVEDQYPFGPDLLVAPITEYQARRRPVYLPAGADWTDAGSGRTPADGVTVTGAAPLEHIPVFVRGHKEELWRLFQGRYQL